MIAEHDREALERLCRYAHRQVAADPDKRSARAKRDADLRPRIQRVWNDNFAVYGAEKVWRQLGREKVAVARCTVERLMRELDLRGAVRGRAFKVTTVADERAVRPPDLVHRAFTAERRLPERREAVSGILLSAAAHLARSNGRRPPCRTRTIHTCCSAGRT